MADIRYIRKLTNIISAVRALAAWLQINHDEGRKTEEPPAEMLIYWLSHGMFK
jgi:hypothetical protein